MQLGRQWLAPHASQILVNSLPTRIWGVCFGPFTGRCWAGHNQGDPTKTIGRGNVSFDLDRLPGQASIHVMPLVPIISYQTADFAMLCQHIRRHLHNKTTCFSADGSPNNWWLAMVTSWLGCFGCTNMNSCTCLVHISPHWQDPVGHPVGHVIRLSGWSTHRSQPCLADLALQG